MEADVIAATVRNAFAQGCATACSSSTTTVPATPSPRPCAPAPSWRRSFGQLDELFKIKLLNQVAAEVSQADDREHIWWLWLDADEFVHGPGGHTLQEFLTPSTGPTASSGRGTSTTSPTTSPSRCPDSIRSTSNPCARRSTVTCAGRVTASTPLQRFDRSGPPITCGIGYHAATCSQILLEPTDTTFTHHFPYRLEATTRLRSETLCGRDGAGCPGSRPTTRWCVATPGPCPTCRSGSARSTTSTPRNGVSSRTSAARAHRSAWSHGRGRPWSTRPTPVRPLVRAGRARLGARVRAGPGVNDPAAAEFRRHRRHAVGIDVALQVPARPPADLHAA